MTYFIILVFQIYGYQLPTKKKKKKDNYLLYCRCNINLIYCYINYKIFLIIKL